MVLTYDIEMSTGIDPIINADVKCAIHALSDVIDDERGDSMSTVYGRQRGVIPGRLHKYLFIISQYPEPVFTWSLVLPVYSMPIMSTHCTREMERLSYHNTRVVWSVHLTVTEAMVPCHWRTCIRREQ